MRRERSAAASLPLTKRTGKTRGGRHKRRKSDWRPSRTVVGWGSLGAAVLFLLADSLLLGAHRRGTISSEFEGLDSSSSSSSSNWEQGDGALESLDSWALNFSMFQLPELNESFPVNLVSESSRGGGHEVCEEPEEKVQLLLRAQPYSGIEMVEEVVEAVLSRCVDV